MVVEEKTPVKRGLFGRLADAFRRRKPLEKEMDTKFQSDFDRDIKQAKRPQSTKAVFAKAKTFNFDNAFADAISEGEDDEEDEQPVRRSGGKIVNNYIPAHNLKAKKGEF